MCTLANATIPVQSPLGNDSISISLSEGTSVVLRPMRSEDAGPAQKMHDRVSADSAYFRYLHPHKPTFEELDCLHRMNKDDGAAFVAAIEKPEKRVVALALYRVEPQNPTVAQPAVLVEDRFQNQGLGRALMRHLCMQAITNGIRIFDAATHPENCRVMHLIKQSGFPFEAKYTYGMCEVRIWLRVPGRIEHDVFAI